ncbi:MAG: ribonuclease R [Alphaproteobacteria bacterium]|nr:ribonuclease R [Alphaproteobacteria bacterium]
MAKKQNREALPSKQEILDYLKRAPGETARRDIARAFGVKNEGRAELRRLIRELEDEGKIERSGRRVVQTETLGPVGAIDVMSVDEDGDLLCLPANWRGETEPPMIRLSARRAAKLKPVPGVGDRLLARLRPAGDDGYEADVIKAIGKAAHRFLAVFRKARGQAVAEPVERRARNRFVIERGDEAQAKDGDLVWIEAKHARGYGPQRARVREIAGHIDDRHAYSLIALAGRGAPMHFPPEALQEAEEAESPLLGDRADLRDAPLVTIDPEDARDHDDAVFAAPDDDPKNEGGYRVVVAIADVSYFVPEGGALDREALRRGNSIYLPDRVVPMLPERLSADLCSLIEGEDRACLAVEMKISKSGRKLSHRFMRGLMRSAAKLSYGDAQKIIEGGGASKEIADVVRTLHAAFRARWEERRHRAPLDLDLPERRIILDADGRVARVERRERYDAHRLIEEFMILANIAAAETLEQRRTPRIYRVHDAPDPERLEATREYLEELGYSLAKGGSVRPANFNQILKLAEARNEKEMISEVILRAQKQAVYSTENLGHFGLNIPRYAHFTSPIRRYADLTVHRALVAALNFGPGAQSPREAAQLERIAEQISDYERRAMAAEREASDRYLAEYLAGRVGAEFEGRIRGVTRFGLFVTLDETGADGFIPMRLLGRERFRFVEERHSVIGESSGGAYRLGQPVRVALAEATPLTGGLRFEMISDPIPDAAPRGKRTATKTAGKKSKRRGGARRRTPKKKQKRG